MTFRARALLRIITKCETTAGLQSAMEMIDDAFEEGDILPNEHEILKAKVKNVEQ